MLLTDRDDTAIQEAATLLDFERVHVVDERAMASAIAHLSDLRGVIATTGNPNALRDVVAAARLRGVPLIIGCFDETVRRRAIDLRADDWYRAPAPPDEIAARMRAAIVRTTEHDGQAGGAIGDPGREERELMLYDALTGLPTLPVMIERCRQLIKERGELLVLYLHFVRYSKLEEIYGWEKLDSVLETTAGAVRDLLDRGPIRSSRLMVSFTNDDDFVFFQVPETGAHTATDTEITALASALQREVGERIEAVHGEEVATLFDIYVGRSHVFYNPKVRLQRSIYRGIREAANAAKSVEDRERARRVEDLRKALREGLVYVDYHPIVWASSGEIFGYEALARGRMRTLRSPEVMFEVAEYADLLWELSRLCRTRAIEGMRDRLQPGQLLFLNVDPQDFADPVFDEMSLEVEDPRRVVIEITERTAIKDYLKFRERLQVFRDRGFRFAVDDAGSGYAGLGSIANLEPDFIKLDMSLIHGIDVNFIKQNLVETMVRFAEEQGAMVIAEGVERVEEFDTVKRLGVHLVQGFYLHREGSNVGVGEGEMGGRS